MSRRKSILLILSVTLTGLLVGAGGTWYAIVTRNPASDLVKVGNWYTQIDAGSPDASAWDRAFVAYHATFAVQPSETIYLVRKRDESGEPLRESCSYEVSGGSLPAHWWSLTIYDAEGFHPRGNLHSSVTSAGITPSAEGEWKITISSGPQPGHWLPSLQAGDFNLVLRLYAPRVKPRELTGLPVIRRVACRG